MDQALLNLSTHHLRYLLALHRHPTLGRAAEELGISPSALSQGLTELERRVGLDLFERRGRTRALTATGREMVDHAERILGATRDLTLWAREAGEGRRGTIRLGLIDIAAVAHFPDTLLRFRTERPDVELHLTVAPSGALVEQLSAGRLDLAVIVQPDPAQSDTVQPDPAQPDPAQTGPVQSDRLQSDTVQPDPGADGPGGTVGLAGPVPEVELAGHPDLVHRELLAEELAVYGPTGARAVPPERWGPWVTFPASSHTRRLIARAVRAAGADFRVEAESHQPEVLRQLVQLGLGWTVLPVLQAETEPAPLVRARPKPLLTRRLGLARRAATPIDPATAHLIDRLRAAAGTVTASGPRTSAGADP